MNKYFEGIFLTTIKEINKIAETVKNNVEKEQKLPIISGYSFAEYGYILAKSVIYPGKDITKIKVNPAPAPTGNGISRSIDKSDYIKLAKNFVNFIEQKKQLPNFSYFLTYKIIPKLLIYCFAKIVVYYKEHKALPNYCNFNSKIFLTNQKTVILPGPAKTASVRFLTQSLKANPALSRETT